MVLQKRLEYGFNGYQVPTIPRATRSARRRCPFKKKVEDNQMCSIDLLATVAGKLLLLNESSPGSTNALTGEDQCAVVKNIVKKELQTEDNPVKVDICVEGNCGQATFVSEPVTQGQRNCSTSASLVPQNEITSMITTSNCSDRVVDKKFVSGETGNKLNVGLSGDSSKPKIDSNFIMKDEMYDEVKVSCKAEDDVCSLGDEDPVACDGKPPAIVVLDSRAQAPVSGDHHVPCCSFPGSQDDVNLVSRDDDENSSGCTHRSTITNMSFRKAPRIGDRRIKKILGSKYWKVASKVKDTTLPNINMDLKPAYLSRKISYKRLRSERNYPIKKRKYFTYVSSSNSGGISSEGNADSPENEFNGDDLYSRPKMHGAIGVSSLVKGQHAYSGDSDVKLRIKSFRVPEIFVELPKTATVGSLKRAVLEAVTAVLGGGLHVGVLLQGKKVKDDSKTLLQTGISQGNQLDALGFCLEPNSSQTLPSLCSEDSSHLLHPDTPQNITRYQPISRVVQQGSCDGLPGPDVGNIGNLIDSDHDSAPSPDDTSGDKSTTDSRALVTVQQPMNVEALSIVPAHRKSKRSEVVQRRIRRPFSVSEVEALVQAVEKLGTGRWRDVKLRAFDNAKHRTYVDLKDKWKTLVHTARISPQQRRGEPVPQELLDRVLSAHAYWSNQAKQQLKQQHHHHHPDTCLLL